MELFIKIFFITLACSAVFFLIAYIISRILPSDKKKQGAKKLSRRRELHELLCTLVYKKNVIRQLSYPQLSKNGLIEGHFIIDECVITSGGLLLLTVCPYGGKIDNNRDDIWLERKNDIVKEFPAPTSVCADYKKYMTRLLKKGGLSGIPVYSLIVLTDNTASLLLPCDNIIPAYDIDSLLTSLKSTHKLDTPKQYALRKLLCSFGKAE